MLVSVGRDCVTLALTWRLYGNESRCHFPDVFFFFFFPSCFPNVFSCFTISNIFPGMQPKEDTDEDSRNAPQGPCLYDCRLK